MQDAHEDNMAGKSPGNLTIAKRSIKACLSSQSVEWCTPVHIVKSVLKVLGNIDLDPCSNSRINPNVPATNLYTKAENGLARTWRGRVYMNPPYGRAIMEWVHKLHNEVQARHVAEAIALLPARTDTAWFRILRNYPKCFVHGRLRFGNAKNSAPFPSVVVYLGTKQRKFQEVFSELGDVYILMRLLPEFDT